MRPVVKFVIILLLGLGFLAFAADRILTETTHGWAKRDLDLRSQLAAASARQGLIAAWPDPVRISKVLSDVTRDERIMGAAVCASSGMVAHTEAFPKDIKCGPILVAATPVLQEGEPLYSVTRGLEHDAVQLSLVPIDGSLGGVNIVLVHDLSFVNRRDAVVRKQLLLAFVIMSLSAALITLLAGRIAWRSWTTSLRTALRAGRPSGDFRPLISDLRELVDKLHQERTIASPEHAWTSERLRRALADQLQDEQIVVVANREPYIHEREADGSIRVMHPASGLVTALEPVMRACSGVWVAHGSGSADRDTVDAHDRIKVPPGEESYQVRRVWLTPEQEQGYYYGFSNEGLWPLCHVAHARPEFRAEDWEKYREVNQSFAKAVCEEVDSDDPIILVQDYHLALVPAMIRKRLPRATILTFWHIPWPNPERLGICPWKSEILGGLLGSSILGFHTQQHCNNLLDGVDHYVEARIDRERNIVVQGARRTLVRPYPISIEWPVHWLEGIADVPTCRREVRASLGLPVDVLLGIGVDRLDYTKGIEERLWAVDKLLEQRPEYRGRFVFVQLAAPSRVHIERYRELNARVDQVAREINDRWSTGAWKPIVLFRAHHEPPSVFRFLRAADVCYVSSLHDGMNLVAKEFVAARDDERGVLMLSKFTGAAKELTEALSVNPYDFGEAAAALATALEMSPDEQQERMRAMRAVVAQFNVYRWAGRMIADAADVRRQERLAGRLASGARATSVTP
jgi:trehalose 6-phosphate synthase